MTIRRAQVGDSQRLAEIVVAGWKWAYEGVISEHELNTLDVSARMRSFKDQFDPELLFLVAVDDADSPIGFAVETTPPRLPAYDAEVGGLYVDPAFTRMGIGKKLVSAMAEQFYDRGASSMAIHTLRKNAVGRAFYEGIGGVVVMEDEWRNYPAVWYAWRNLCDLIARD